MSDKDQQPYLFGPFELEVGEQRLLWQGEEVPLTPKVFEVLRLLVERNGHLVEREEFLKEIWRDAFVEEASLSRAISVLRKVLEERDGTSSYIETIPKRGYRFVGSVTRRPQIAPAANRDRVFNGRYAWVVGALIVGIIAAITSSRATRSSSPEVRPPRMAASHRQITFNGREGIPSLSKDSAYIAYVSSATPVRRVMVQSGSGGDPVSIFEAPEIGNLRWSPDGTELLLWSRDGARGGVYIVPRLGGSPKQLMAGVFMGCWSPDGSTVAIARYLSGEITLLDTLGRERRTIQLHNVRRWIADLDWSPAGDRILFVSNDDSGTYAISTIKPDGTDQRQLVTSPDEISAARWAPKGDAIYYFRRDGQTVSLLKVGVAGSSRNANAGTPLLTGLEADGAFSLSEDSVRLVYARAPFHSNLWTLQLSDSGPARILKRTQLTDGTSLVERPRVSPDGTRVLFSVGREGASELYTMPLAGGPSKRLTFLNTFSLGGAWSSDGRKVAFASNRGGKSRVWTIGVDGEGPEAVSSGELSDSFEVSWAPGPVILYQQIRNRNFYVLDADTRQERLLLTGAPQGWIFSPVFSRDAKRVAVAWNRRPNRGLWIIDSSGEGKPIYKDSIPVPVGWSQDDTTIYAIDGKRSAYRGIVVNLGETLSEARLLAIAADGSGLRSSISLPFEEIGGVSLAPDSRTLVCTVFSSRSDVWIVDNFDAP